MSHVNFPSSDLKLDYLQFASGEDRDRFKPFAVQPGELFFNQWTQGADFPLVFGPKKVVPISPQEAENVPSLPSLKEFKDQIRVLPSLKEFEEGVDSLHDKKTGLHAELSSLFEEGKLSEVTEIIEKVLNENKSSNEEINIALSYREKIMTIVKNVEKMTISINAFNKQRDKQSIQSVSDLVSLILLQCPKSQEYSNIRSEANKILKELCDQEEQHHRA